MCPERYGSDEKMDMDAEEVMDLLEVSHNCRWMVVSAIDRWNKSSENDEDMWNWPYPPQHIM